MATRRARAARAGEYKGGNTRRVREKEALERRARRVVGRSLFFVLDALGSTRLVSFCERASEKTRPCRTKRVFLSPRRVARRVRRCQGRLRRLHAGGAAPLEPRSSRLSPFRERATAPPFAAVSLGERRGLEGVSETNENKSLDEALGVAQVPRRDALRGHLHEQRRKAGVVSARVAAGGKRQRQRQSARLRSLPSHGAARGDVLFSPLDTFCAPQVKEGQGIMYYADDSKYIGDYRNGMMDGADARASPIDSRRGVWLSDETKLSTAATQRDARRLCLFSQTRLSSRRPGRVHLAQWRQVRRRVASGRATRLRTDVLLRQRARLPSTMGARSASIHLSPTR